MHTRTKKLAKRATTLSALTAAGTLAFSGIAVADTLQDTIADDGAGVTLVKGSSTPGTASIKLIGNNAAGDPDPQCNIDAGEAPLTLDIVTPAGVTATPDPLVITSCGDNFAVSFVASSSAVSGTATVAVLSGPAGNGTYVNNVSIPITVTNPNTKPSVAVVGAVDGGEYVIGDEPTPMCDVTDAEQTDVTDFTPVMTGTLVNGLGSQAATCNWTDAGGLKADASSVTYSIVAPPNTKPSVAVTGVVDGARYEIGSVPAAGCDVTDTEDGPGTSTPVTSGSLSHGLGSQTVTCDATDSGGLAADTATATYTIEDTGKPTISGTPSPAANAAGWNNTDVTVDFVCADSGSGIQSCEEDVVLGEGANQSVTGTATDWAGNTETGTVSGINVDKTDPALNLAGGPTDGGVYYFDGVPALSFDPSDALSGLDSTKTGISGHSTSVGTHTMVAKATDLAGNVVTETVTYEVKAWTTRGFYSPVDTTTGATKIWNTAKGGSTIPLKFELFKGATEVTDVAKVAITIENVTNPSAITAADEIEALATTATSLRYDTVGGQFIRNWKTPTGAGAYKVTMTALDGTTAVAYFTLRK